MRVINVVFFLVALDALSAQNVFTSHMADANVTIEERLEPPTPRLMNTSSGIGPPEDKSWISGFRRLVTDNANHDFFGYNVVVDRMGTTGSFRVSFQPVSGGARAMNLPNPSVWTMLATPNLPADQIVHSGDTIVLELFKNDATGQKIVDYIKVDATVPCDGSVPCLTGFTRIKMEAVRRKIAAIQDNNKSLVRDDLLQSQQDWEKYKAEACRAIPDDVRQLECQLKLTSSRLADLNLLY